MSLYVVKNDKGEWLYSDEYTDWVDQLSQATFYDTFEDADDDIEGWELSNAYIVELTESPAKVVVSEEEAEALKNAERYSNPLWSLWASSSVLFNDHNQQVRLIRAYVNGWVVEKPKRWNVKVPQKWSGDDKHYWTKEQDGALTWAYLINKDYTIPAQQFTAAEIEHYGLQDCEKEEVTDDDD